MPTITATTNLFNDLLSRTTSISRYQKGKTSLHLNEARDDGVLGCSGISWTICKQSATRCRQITTPALHHSIFTGWMLVLMPSQQCQNTEGKSLIWRPQKSDISSSEIHIFYHASVHMLHTCIAYCGWWWIICFLCCQCQLNAIAFSV